jgi:hypothetical protein
MATGSFFDEISTGDIQLFSNIGNQNMSSQDVAAMIIGLSSSQNDAKREAELNEQQERERRLVISVSASISLGLLLLIIYLLSLKLNNRVRTK